MTTDAPEQTEVPRDRWGRPLILQPDGEAIPYTRASTMAKALDDLSNLMLWKQRKTAEGLLRRPDLLTRLSGVLAKGNPDEDRVAKRLVNNICDEATEAAGATTGRTAGSGFHDLTEAIDRGEEPLFVPDADRKRLEAYRTAMAGCVPLDAETFVVIDELQVAGSFDRLWLCANEGREWWHDGRVRVGDLKSGKSEKAFPLATCMQLALYAHGKRYDPETGERTPLHEDIDLTTGLLVHMPPSGGCEVVPLDLDKGWRAARLAAEVHHDVRKWKAADLIVGGAA